MTPEILLSFTLTCIAIELTPGPNMTYLALLSAIHGRKAGFSAIVGIGLGLSIIGVAAALGAAAIITQSPILYDTMRWVGVAYLLWLAYDCWRGEDGVATSHEGYDPRYFTRGLITNLLNPKAALFYITVIPAFTQPNAAILPQALTLTAIYVSIATTIHVVIVLLGARIKPYLENERIAKYARYFFAALLVVIAIWFALSSR